MTTIMAADLFAGAGGMSTGLMAACVAAGLAVSVRTARALCAETLKHFAVRVPKERIA